MINPFRNITLTMQAVGWSAIMCTWVIGVSTLGVLGSGAIAETALNYLGIVGAMLVSSAALGGGAQIRDTDPQQRE